MAMDEDRNNDKLAPGDDVENAPAEPAGAKPVADYRQAPKGVLPKNAQTWVFLAISVAVVLVVLFFGPEPPDTSAPNAESESSPVTASEPLTAEEDVDARIAELERQMQEGMRSIPRASAGFPPPPSTDFDLPVLSDELEGLEPDGAAERSEQLRELETSSLFESSIALTYRQDDDYRAAAAAATTRLTTSSPAAANPYGDAPYAPEPYPVSPPPLFASAPPATPAAAYDAPLPPPSGTAPPAASVTSTGAAGAPAPGQVAATDTPAGDSFSSRPYRLFEGTVLETTLVNRLDSSFSGPILTLLTHDVYSHDRTRVLLPAGTKCLGRTTAVDSLGQTRMAVTFHRLLMPDGYAVDLEQFEGLNQLGDTGLRDRVNRHYVQIFGTSLALGFLGGVSQNRLEAPFDSSGPQLARSAAQILDRFLNIAPTVTIREGHRVKVYLTQDLVLPAYDDHPPLPGV